MHLLFDKDQTRQSCDLEIQAANAIQNGLAWTKPNNDIYNMLNSQQTCT